MEDMKAWTTSSRSLKDRTRHDVGDGTKLERNWHRLASQRQNQISHEVLTKVDGLPRLKTLMELRGQTGQLQTCQEVSVPSNTRGSSWTDETGPAVWFHGVIKRCIVSIAEE